MERDGGRLSRFSRFYTLVEEGEKSRFAVTQRASAADKVQARMPVSAHISRVHSDICRKTLTSFVLSLSEHNLKI